MEKLAHCVEMNKNNLILGSELRFPAGEVRRHDVSVASVDETNFSNSFSKRPLNMSLLKPRPRPSGAGAVTPPSSLYFLRVTVAQAHSPLVHPVVTLSSRP